MSLVQTKKVEKSKSKKSIVITLFTMVFMLVGMLTFSACSVFKVNSNGGNAAVDANGNLRITSPFVSFITHNMGSGGTATVDKNTGSFSWALSFYLANAINGDEETLKTTEFDQISFNSFYTDSNYQNLFGRNTYTTLNPIYVDGDAASNKTKVQTYFTPQAGDVQERLKLDGMSTFVFDLDGVNDKGLYSIIRVEDYSNTRKFVFGRVYSPLETLINSPSAESLIQFPDYEVIVDGKYYSYQVTLNPEYLDFATGTTNLAKKTNLLTHKTDSSGNPLGKLFTFSYRVGKSSTNNYYQECTSGHMDYYIDDETGNFMVRYNPQLQAGTTQRYLKVRAISNSEYRADSVFSGAVSFDAYSLTFNAYSPNSSFVSYEGLEYDSDQYYFHTVKTTLNETGDDVVTSLTGVFAEGKVVEVDRKALDDGDYAFQSWTTNTKAENALILPNGNPTSTSIPLLRQVYKHGSNYYYNEYTPGGNNVLCSSLNVVQVGSNYYDADCIPNAYATTQLKSLINISSSQPANKIYNYFFKSYLDFDRAGFKNLAEELIIDNGTFLTGKLSVVSHVFVNNYKFYANIAKVKNFIVSGTVFNGDNFFGTDNQYLNDYTLSVFGSDNQKITSFNGDGTVGNLTCKIDGSEFIISGLNHGDYVLFEKVENSGAVGAAKNHYTFHNPVMTYRDLYGAVSYKVLGVQESDTLYLDRSNVGIIATKYKEDSNLIVNLYQTTESGQENINGTNLKLLADGSVSYEIIETSNSVVDDNGYVTTNVIISILLPSNATLIGYNTETLNNKTAQFFTYSGSNYLALMMDYNASTLSYDNLRPYTVSVLSNISSGVTASDNSIYVYYGNEVYVYDKVVKSGTSSMYYYNNIKNNTTGVDDLKVLVKTENGGSSNWKLISYTKQDASTISYNDGNYYYGGNKLTEHNATNDVLSNDLNEVGYIVKAYASEMMQIDNNGTPDDVSDDEENLVYIYYDIKSYMGGKLFVAPVGMQTIIVNEVKDGNGNITGTTEQNQTTLFYPEISNFDALISAETIMLGSDILRSSNGNAKQFREALGAKIVQNCYYYIIPLASDPQELRVKQYISDDKNDKYTTIITKYLDDSGNEYSVIDKANVKDGTKNVYDIITSAVDSLGAIIDTTTFNSVKTQDTKYSLTNGYSEYFVNANNFNLSSDVHSMDSHETIMGADFFVAKYHALADYTGKEIRYRYFLYQIVYDGTGAGSLVKTEMRRSGNQYYKVTKNGYFSHSNVVYDGYECETNPTSLEFANPTTSDFIMKNYALSSVGGVSTVVGGRYTAYLIPEYYISYIENIDYTLEDAPIYTLAEPQIIDNNDGTYKIKLYTNEKSTHTVGGTRYLNPTTDDPSAEDIEVLSDDSGLYYYIEVYKDTLNNYYYSYDATNGYTLPVIVNGKLVDYTQFNSTVRIRTVYYFTYNDGNSNPNNGGNSDPNKLYRVYAYSGSYYYKEEYDTTNNVMAYSFDVFNASNELLNPENLTGVLKREVRNEQKYSLTLKNSSGDTAILKQINISIDAVYDYYPAIQQEKDQDGNIVNYFVEYKNGTNGAKVKILLTKDGSIYKYSNGNQYIPPKLNVETDEKEVIVPANVLMRTAQLLTNNTNVTLLGKYIQTNNDPIIYPSFSNLNTYTEEESKTIGKDASGGFSHYYSLDYTTKKAVVEGFPGVSLLAGIPYPNPVLHFSIRHKANEASVVNVALDIKYAYFVEILGTNIRTDDSSLIQDFTTYSFKDTVTNLTQNDYIDKTYYILDKNTFEFINVYQKNLAGGFDLISDSDGKAIPLRILDIAFNEGDPKLYFNNKVNANGLYIDVVYRKVTENGIDTYVPIDYENDVILWETTSTKISNVPTYDIHSYSQNADGIIYFDSGINTDDNNVCIGLEGITAGATQSENGFYNYDNVLISGVTSAYRTLSSELKISDNEYYGYWMDKPLEIIDGYDSKSAYFLTGKESVFLIASPVVNLQDETGTQYVYRFKQWQIYSRYNSEVLYYNRNYTEGKNGQSPLPDIYNAIMRFSSNEAGYFVFLPVYERVYTVNLGTAVIDGPINLGGGVEVLYDGETGQDVDVNNSYIDTLYSVEYFKTVYNDREGYFYKDIEGHSYLWFTGKKTSDGQPIFAKVDDIYALNADLRLTSSLRTGKTTLFYQLEPTAEGLKFKAVNLLTSYIEDVPGLVRVYNDNGLYFTDVDTNGYFSQERGFYLGDKNGNNPIEVKFEEIVNTCFTGKFFYDTINSDSNIEISVYYDEVNRVFKRIDLNAFSAQPTGLAKKVIGAVKLLAVNLMYYNLKQNSHIFPEELNGFIETIADFVLQNVVKLTNTDITLTTLDQVKQQYFTEVIAKSIQQEFTVLNVNNNVSVNGLYVSKSGSLYSGELTLDENGNTYSTLQFKSAYLDRDTYIELNATPDLGYRVEGWYKCIYDESLNAWLTTEEKVENSKPVYFDEVLQAFYNQNNKQYYFITEYYEETDNEGLIYYLDEDKTVPALVPKNLLDKVRGFFINAGTEENPNYVQVYAKATTGKPEYYYDQAFSRLVDENLAENVVEKTYLEAINKEEDPTGEEGFATLSNQTIYVVKDKETETFRYFRSCEEGNIRVDGNKLIINKLHANVRYIAKFIEVYSEYIFSEDEDSSGVKIQAIYYNSSDENKADDEDPTIRTDAFGYNKTADDQEDAYQLDHTLFSLYEEDKIPATGALTFNETYLDKTFEYTNPLDPAEKLNKPYYYAVNNSGTVTNASLAYRGMINGFANAEYGNQYVGDLSYKVVEQNEAGEDLKLNLKNMYFDCKTTVYILARVNSDVSLTAHSLGLNSTYEISPIFAPTDEYIAYNQAQDEGKKVHYYYYLFKVTYDRNPENDYVEYIVHPTRGQSIAQDVIFGNYINFYKNTFNKYLIRSTYESVKFGTNQAIQLDLTNTNHITINTNGTIKLNSGIVDSLNIDTSIKNSIKSQNFKNIKEALEAINNAIGKPGCLQIEGVMVNGSLTTDPYVITNKIKELFVKPPYLLTAGQRNYVNLSTIPIYNYIFQTLTMDKDSAIVNDYEKSQSSNTYHTISNKVYVSAGTSGKTYMGEGTREELASSYEYGNGVTKFKFDVTYSGLPYLITDSTVDIDNAKNKHILQDAPFAENTILLIEKASALQAGYEFAGWYEKKFDKETQTWSEFSLMSNDLQKPYLSIATADTIVVALYKQVEEVKISYNEEQFNVLLNNNLDGLGNPLDISTDPTHITTIKGEFFFDTEIPLTVIPKGGYRLNLSESLKYSKITNYIGEDITSTPILNDVMNIYLKVLNIDDKGTAEKSDDTASINNLFELESTKTTQLFGYIENFYYVDNQGTVDAPIYLKDISVKLSDSTHTYFDSAIFNNENLANFSEYASAEQFLDDTNSPIYVRLNNGNLYFYGYFDNTKDNLKIESNFSSLPHAKWFINNNLESTADKNIQSDTFEIKFSGTSNDDDFGLNADNSLYYIEAFVYPEETVVKVQSVIKDSISSEDKIVVSDVNSYLTFTGMYDGENNGQFETKYDEEYIFDPNSIISLSINTTSFDSIGYKFVFVGWYYAEEATQTFTLLTQDEYLTNRTAKGIYQAVYIKATAIDLDVENNGQALYTLSSSKNVNIIDADGLTQTVQTLRFINNKYYLLNEEDVKLNISIEYIGKGILSDYSIYRTVYEADPTNAGYSLESKTTTTINNGRVSKLIVDTYLDKTEDATKTDITVELNFTEGLQLTVNQNAYDSADMMQTGTAMSEDNKVIINYTVDGEEKTENATTHVVSYNDLITLTLTEQYDGYAFAGWFVNGEKKGNDETYTLALTLDTVIEARFVRVIKVKVYGELVVGTSINTLETADKFEYTLSYKDILSGETISEVVVNQEFYVPNGIIVNLTQTPKDNSQSFFRWILRTEETNSTDPTTYSVISDNSETAITLNEITDVEVLHLRAQYTRTTILNLYKEFNVLDNSILTQEFKEQFSFTIEYHDASGEVKTTSINAYDKLENIIAQTGTVVKITPNITASVADQYFLSSARVDRDSVLSTQLALEEEIEIELSSARETSVYVIFAEASSLLVIKELDGIRDDSSKTNISYTINAQNGEFTGISEKSFTLSSGSSYSINTYKDSSYKSLIFAGWYLNGEFLTSDEEITDAYITAVGHLTLIAKYTSAINVSFKHETNGTNTTSPDVSMIMAGIQLQRQPDNSYLPIYNELTAQSSIYLMNQNSSIVLTTNVIDGYQLVGFKIVKHKGTETTTDELEPLEDSYNSVLVYTHDSYEYDRIELIAVYKEAYSVSYVINTIDTDGDEVIGGTIKNNTSVITSLEDSITFEYTSTSNNYKFNRYFVNGVEQDSIRYKGTISCVVNHEISELKNYVITIEVVETKKLQVRISVDGTNDIYEIENKLGLDPTLFDVRFGSSANATPGQGIYTFNQNVGTQFDLSIKYNGETNIKDGADVKYYFAGWFLYDERGVGYSYSPLTHQNTTNITLTNNLSLVAKFEKEEPTYLTDTDTTYLFIEGDAQTELKSLSTVIDNGDRTYTKDGINYLDVGTFVKVSNISGSTFVKVNDNEAGKYNNVYRMFTRINSFGINSNNVNSVYVVANITQKYYLDQSFEQKYINHDTTVKLTYIAGSYINTTYFAQEGYNVDSSAVKNPLVTNRSEVLVNPTETKTITSTKNAIKTIINVANNNITASNIETEAILYNRDAESGNIIEEVITDSEFEFTFEISTSSTSSMTVSISSPYGSFTQETVTSSEAKTLNIIKGSIITITINASEAEHFINLTKNGSVLTTEMSYVITVGSETATTIVKANFNVPNISTIKDADANKGDTFLSYETLTEGELEYTFSATAKNGFAIKDIKFAGTDGQYYSLYTQIANVNNIITIKENSDNEELSDGDFFGKTYRTKQDLIYTVDQNVSVVVEYVRVTTLMLKVYTGEDVELYDIYIYENTSPLTLDNFNTVVQSGITDTDQKALINYNSVSDEIAYQNAELTSASSIDYSDLDILELSLYRKANINVKVLLNISSLYDTPKDGIKILLGDEELVAETDGSYLINYVLFESKAIYALDTNAGHYRFLTFTDAVNKVITNNSNLVLTSELLADEQYDFEWTEINKTYTIIANFEEDLTTLKVMHTDVFAKVADQVLTENDITEVTLDSGDVVKVDFKLSASEDYWTITYNKALLGSEKINVIIENFSENAFDPTLGSYANVDKFYDNVAKQQRFHKFTVNGAMVGELYNNNYEFEASLYTGKVVIVPEIKKINLVQFGYNKLATASTFTLTLNILDPKTIVSGSPKVLGTSTLTNSDDADNTSAHYMQVWVEEGLFVNASVTSTDDANIVCSDEADLSSIYNVLITTPLSETEDVLDLDGFVYASKFGLTNATKRSGNTDVNIVLTNFYFSSQKLSLIADFFGKEFNEVKAPIIIQVAPSLGNKLDSNIIVGVKNASGATISFNYAHTGAGFGIAFITDNKEISIDKNQNGINELFSDDQTTSVVYVDTTTITFDHERPQTSILLESLISSSIQVDPYKLNKQNCEEGATHTKITDGINFEITVTPTVSLSTDDEKNKFENGKELTISANVPEGYIFKGFMIYSTGYASQINVSSYSSQVLPNVPYSTYLLIDGTPNNNKVETTIKVYGNVVIRALYEAKPYVITLNTYEYFVDKYNGSESSCLTNTLGNKEAIYAGVVKGSLIVEHGQTHTLTSITYPYKQFVGWLNEDPSSPIQFSTTQGTEERGASQGNLSTSAPQEGYNHDEDTAKSQASRNNLHIYNIQKDMSISAYYTALSYKITIDLGEVLTTIAYNDKTSYQDTYLVYADYIRTKEDWKNPSAGTYSLNSGNGSKDANMWTGTKQLTIADNDPYVYTFVTTSYDLNNGGSISSYYPVKVQSSLIDQAKSSVNECLTYKTGKIVYIATPSASTDTKAEYVDLNTNSAKKDLFREYFNIKEDTDQNNDKYERIISKLDSKYRYGFDYALPEYKGGHITFDSIYNYLNANNSSMQNLFSITSEGKVLNTIQRVESNGQYQYVYKVTANESGFPQVKINFANSDKLPSAITPYLIKTSKYIPTSQNENIQGSTFLSGFNLGLFEDDASFNDPEFNIGNLDVNVQILWQQSSLAVDAKIDGVQLTGTKDSSCLSDLICGDSACRTHVRTKLYQSNHYEIEHYYLVVLENAQIYLQFLNDVANKSLNSMWAPLDKKTANALLSQFASFSVGTTIENQSYVKDVGHMWTGTFTPDSDFVAKFDDLWGKYQAHLGYSYVQKDLTFNYRMVDAFELYRNSVDRNMYGNYINANDIVISQVILQEHQINQHNETRGGWLGLLWWADKGYDYFKNATLGFGSAVADGALQSAKYDNDFSKLADAQTAVDAKWTQDVANYFTGMFNGDKKYTGTYSRMLHYMALCDNYEDVVSEYISLNSKGIFSTLRINQAEDTRIRSALHDYDETPVTNILLVVTTGVLAVATGGIGSVIVFALIIADGIILIAAPADTRTIFDMITNINLT